MVKYLHMIESIEVGAHKRHGGEWPEYGGSQQTVDLKGMGLAHLELLECLVIHIEVPMIMPEAPDEIREMSINLVVLHLDQGFVQLAMIPCFESAITFMA